MMTSGVYTQSSTRNELIRDAFTQAGVLDIQQDITAAQMVSASRFLNNILMYIKMKAEESGVALFLLKDMILFLTQGQPQYTFPGARVCLASDFVQTSLSVDASTAATVITVTSVTGLAVSDKIGISNGTTLFWTTITVIAGSNVTLAAGLPAALSAGVPIYIYTTAIPYKIMGIYAATVGNATGTEVPMASQTRYDYAMLPAKTVQNLPTQYSFNPNVGFSDVFVWQTAANEENFLKITAQIPIELMTLANSDFTLPDEWILPVTSRLAWQLAVNFALPDNVADRLERIAEQQLVNVINFSKGNEPFQIVTGGRDYDPWRQF